MIRLTDATFEPLVLEATGTHIVLFASDGCHSCHAQRALLLELKALEQFQHCTFFSVDKCDAPYFFSEYLERDSIPTTCVFRGGELLGSFLGHPARPEDFIVFLTQHVGDYHV